MHMWRPRPMPARLRLSAASDMFPKKAVASVTGIGTLSGFGAGGLFQWLIGVVLATYRASDNIETGYMILFGVCASMYLTALLLFHILAPRMEIARV